MLKCCRVGTAGLPWYNLERRGCVLLDPHSADNQLQAISRALICQRYFNLSSELQHRVLPRQLAVSKLGEPAPTMANNQPLHVQATRFALDVAKGRHALSKLIPPLLFLADALLCALIIWKVPCKPPLTPSTHQFTN